MRGGFTIEQILLVAEVETDRNPDPAVGRILTLAAAMMRELGIGVAALDPDAFSVDRLKVAADSMRMSDAARIVGVERVTLYMAARRGAIKTHHVPGMTGVRVYLSDVQEWNRKRRKESNPPAPR